MKRLLYLPFALFSLSACDDKIVDTIPPHATTDLLVKWQGLSTHEVDTTPAGQVASDNTTTYPAGSYYLEFTPTEMLVYAGATVSKLSAYTVANNVITLQPAVAGEGAQRIEDITPTRLVLTTTRLGSGSNTKALTTTYGR